MVSMLSAAACVALLGGCTTPQFPASSPGTTPSVWTGSPAPPSGTSTAPVSASAAASATTPATESRGSKPQSLVAQLKAPDGTQVATATFDFANGFATITIATTGGTQLSPGFHGLHIHKTGKCEPNSVAPTGGPPGDFNSAGGHFQAPGHTGEPASGDLTSLQVRKDGSANLVTTTDAFTMDDLTAGEKTAIIIHAGADNFANIPLDRYIQLNGTPGPDATTMSTGDAGRRVACGVIGAG